MKKTLIALAAVAAATAASAQVSISGLIGAEILKSGSSRDTTYGLHDGNIKFAASEDLGGGMKVSASTEIRAGGRTQGNVTTRDASVSLSGAFGTVTASNAEAGNALFARGYAGAPVIGADDNVILDGGDNVAGLKYTAPAINGFVFSVGTTAGKLNGGNTVVKPTLGVAYKAGAIDASLDYQPKSERMRGSVSYDLGVAKVGAGFTSEETFTSTTSSGYIANVTGTTPQSTTLVGFSMPLSAALTVGAGYAVNTSTDADQIDVGAAYALSKRTEASIAAAKASTASNTTVRVRLSHSF